MNKGDIATVILIGLFFVTLAVPIVIMSVVNIFRIRKIKDFCSKRFDQIEEALKADMENKKELTSLVNEIRGHLKNQNY